MDLVDWSEGFDEAAPSTGIQSSDARLVEDQDVSELEDDDASSANEHDGRQAPPKRAAKDTITHRPFKRQRSTFNLTYLDLLNHEIRDAAQRTVIDDSSILGGSQLGLTWWTSNEKHKFFEALARLGKNNVSAISSAIGTKSIVEVCDYMSLLEDVRDDRHDTLSRPVLEFYKYPAAVEISQQCARVQEEAADELHLRQEAREEEREQKRWDGIWDVTATIATRLDREVRNPNLEQPPPPFAQLFHTSRWLELSRRMFMNSSIPSSNWNFVESTPPSVWATAFQDFHSLAVSITRRLVQTTLFMAMTRIKTKRAGGSKIRDWVRLQDAEGAVSSLGMASNMNKMWIQSARRLRLEVYETPPDRDENGDDSSDEEIDQEPMSYDEVERRLSDEQVSEATPSGYMSQMAQGSSPEEEEEEEEDDKEAIEAEEQASDLSRSPSPLNDEEREIRQEADEILMYAASGLRRDKATKNALRARIASERLKERHADEHDDYASYKAELEMWNILQKKPPMELPKRPEPAAPKKANFDVEGMYPAGRDWMRKLEYRSEWETLPEWRPRPAPGEEEGEGGAEDNDRDQEEEEEEEEKDDDEQEEEQQQDQEEEDEGDDDEDGEEEEEHNDYV